MLGGFERALVTGGAGFIGSHVTERLVQLGKEVTLVDSLRTGRKENISREVRFVRGDITDLEEVRANLRDVDVVFHAAAQTSTPKSVEDPLLDFRINALGTLNVLRAALDSEVKKVVYCSTAAVFGQPRYLPVDEKHPFEPISPYGASKLAGELYCLAFYRTYGLRTVSLRFFNVYGPRENLETTLDEVALYLSSAMRNRAITVLGDGNQSRDFVYVKDIARALLLAADSKSAEGRAFNIGTGVETSINDLVDTIERVTGRKAVVRHKPWRKGDIHRSFADISKARTILGFSPRYTLKDGIQELAGNL